MHFIKINDKCFYIPINPKIIDTEWEEIKPPKPYSSRKKIELPTL